MVTIGGTVAICVAVGVAIGLSVWHRAHDNVSRSASGVDSKQTYLTLAMDKS